MKQLKNICKTVSNCGIMPNKQTLKTVFTAVIIFVTITALFTGYISFGEQTLVGKALASATETDDFENGNNDGWSGGTVTSESWSGNSESQSLEVMDFEPQMWTGGPTVSSADGDKTSALIKYGPGTISWEFHIRENSDNYVEVFGDGTDPYYPTIAVSCGGNTEFYNGNYDMQADRWDRLDVIFENGQAKLYMWPAGTSRPTSPVATADMNCDIEGQIGMSTQGSQDYINADWITAGATSSTVSGQVTDTDGNAISNATVESNTSVSTTTNSNGQYSMSLTDSTHEITAQKDGYTQKTKTVTVEGDTQVDFSLTELSNTLVIESDPWLGLNSSTPFKVLFTDENNNTEDVTASSTIESSNVSVLSVDKANKVFNSGGYNKTVAVNVTYTYSGSNFYTETNITVAARTIDNIGIMPPSQYITTFLGFGETDSPGGMGSEIQFLFLIIFIMSAIAYQFKNPWIGISSAMMISIILMIIEWVSLGIVLTIVFTGILISLIVVRTRKQTQSEVNVNLDNGQ